MHVGTMTNNLGILFAIWVLHILPNYSKASIALIVQTRPLRLGDMRAAGCSESGSPAISPHSSLFLMKCS